MSREQILASPQFKEWTKYIREKRLEITYKLNNYYEQF